MPWLIIKQKIGIALRHRSAAALLPSWERAGPAIHHLCCVLRATEQAQPPLGTQQGRARAAVALCSWAKRTNSKRPPHAQSRLRVWGRD